MPDEKGQEKTPPVQPNPQDDIVEGLFGEEKPTPPAPVQTETPEKPKEEGKEDKIDVQAIVKEAVSQAVEQIKPLINQSASNLTRQQQLDNWFRSDDGQMFGKYKDIIQKAALLPQFSGLPISQIPGAILKPQAYSKVLQEARDAADREARDSKTGGGSARSAINPGGDERKQDYSQSAMPREEFLKVANENKRKIKSR